MVNININNHIDIDINIEMKDHSNINSCGNIGISSDINININLQAFVPAVFIIGPLAISIIRASMEKSGAKISLILAAMMAFYPIAEPLITIIFVKPYYNAIFGRFIRKKEQDTTETPERIVHRDTQISVIQNVIKISEAIEKEIENPDTIEVIGTSETMEIEVRTPHTI